ncbi:MAG: threonylcarbamoyl-AMP synthase [Nitrospirae bacterium GWC2_42_7]|nr:MAG: threonylcarbamoyl-AMP synthase [Nitrospirae bacterium GWC2_42_7]
MKVSEVGKARAVAEACRIIKEGGIVAFPTETFYGLGVKYDNISALKKLYEIKKRPKEKAMPLIIDDMKMLSMVASSVSDIAHKLMQKFWPGPLTLLLNAKEDLSEFIVGEAGKVAVRMPGESFALDFAKALEFPITATSANISGVPPADTPGNVVMHFGDNLDLLIDGERTPGGMPSTIVDASGDEIRIMRSGVIPSEEILKFVSFHPKTEVEKR